MAKGKTATANALNMLKGAMATGKGKKAVKAKKAKKVTKPYQKG